MMARPTKLNPHVQAIICGALVASRDIDLACLRADIARRTYNYWRKLGREELDDWTAELQAAGINLDTIGYDDLPNDRLPHASFLLATEKALADFELIRLGRIARAGEGVPVKRTVTRTRKFKRVVAGELVDVTETETTITEGIERSWQADAWLLERTCGAKYARTVKSEVSGPAGGPVEVHETRSELEDQALADLAARGERLRTARLN
jgi:hypothetical protein